MRRIFALFAVAALLLAGCGSDDSQSPAQPGSSSTGGVERSLAGAGEQRPRRVGRRPDGMALYMFVPDQQQDESRPATATVRRRGRRWRAR